MASLTDYREQFAIRLRSLRESAGISIERASEQGGLSSNFWGSVERMAQEPCLNTIFGFAQGLGISVPTLMTFKNGKFDDEGRRELDNVLDLLSPEQLHLVLQISKLIFNYNTASQTTGSAPTAF